MISEKMTFFFSYSSVHQEEIDNRSIPIFSLSIYPPQSFHFNGAKHYYGQNCVPQKDTFKLSPLTSQNVTLFENRVCISSVQISSVAQSCPTLCDPMNGSMPGLPVRHLLPDLTQTHAHRVGDAIQPFHPLSSPSPPAPNPSKHQGLFRVCIKVFKLKHGH